MKRNNECRNLKKGKRELAKDGTRNTGRSKSCAKLLGDDRVEICGEQHACFCVYRLSCSFEQCKERADSVCIAVLIKAVEYRRSAARNAWPRLTEGSIEALSNVGKG